MVTGTPKTLFSGNHQITPNYPWLLWLLIIISVELSGNFAEFWSIKFDLRFRQQLNMIASS